MEAADERDNAAETVIEPEGTPPSRATAPQPAEPTEPTPRAASPAADPPETTAAAEPAADTSADTAAEPAADTAADTAAESAVADEPDQADQAAQATEDDQGGKPAKAPAKKRSFWKELPILAAAAIVLAIVIKSFLVQAFFIPSSSMEKTLHGCPGCSGDRVLVNKLVYRFRDVHRGDIVVFKGTGRWEENQEYQFSKPSNPFSRALHWVSGSLGLGVSGETDYIKRVIAVGGDTVTCCDSQGRVTVNGYPLNEPYVFEPASMQPGACVSRPFAPVTVPKGQLWVMGDHRSDSSDSRCKGPVREKDVIGKAFVTIWPPSRWRTLGTPSTFHHVPKPDGEGLPAAPTGPDPVTVAGLALTPWLYRRARRRSACHLPTPS